MTTSISYSPTQSQAVSSTFPKLKFEAQGHYVVVKWSETPSTKFNQKPVNGTRGKIAEFSPRSRKRMLEMVARLDLAGQVSQRPIIFITLTYAAQFPSAEASKQHLRAFLERIRRFAPDASGVWRLEFQERGAPHYHFIFFNLPYLPKAELTSIWGDIIGIEWWDTSRGQPRPPMTRIEAIRNPRKAMAYVSKYVAKNSPSDSGFNDVPYLHAGRFWGVFNKENLPFAQLVAIVLSAESASIDVILFQFKRLMAKKWSRANKFGRLKGASVFVDYASCWKDAFLWSVMEYGSC